MKFTITNHLEHSTNVNMHITFGNISLEEALKIISAIESETNANLSKLDKEIIAIIKSGSHLQAVKYHKEKTGFGLKESKDYCDQLKIKYCTQNTQFENK